MNDFENRAENLKSNYFVFNRQIRASPAAQMVKMPTMQLDPGSIPRSGRSPGEGNGSPLQSSCLKEFHGQRSLVGCSPWGYKEWT